MLSNRLFLGLTLAPLFFQAQGWALTSSVNAENTLAFTSNASLASTPDADIYDKIGATARFPIAQTTNRFSVRYAQYLTQSQNNLLSIDYVTSWKSRDQLTYEARVFDRSYVKQEVGTTDQGFSRFGAAFNTSWTDEKNQWTFKPTGELDHYSSLNRNDVVAYFQLDHELLAHQSDSSFNLSFAPGFNLSTVSEFSRLYLNSSVYFEQPAGEDSYWSLSLDLTYNAYLSRAVDSLVLSGRNGRTTTAVTTKESTWLFSPAVSWSKTFARDWEFRAEALANLQNSKSGTYNFSEVQLLASIQWRL